VGAFAAAFLSATVPTAASNSANQQSQRLGQAVQTVVVVFAFVAALQQLQIQFVGEVFLIILAGLSLGAAIAFGLGCKDIAGRWVSGLIDQLQVRKR
jgi:cell division protein FtsW (lipid II flippase)